MVLSKILDVLKDKKGQGMVEYAILIGAISVVCLTSASLLGHKAGNLMGIGAALLPGDDGDDQGPIFVSKLAATQQTGNNGISLQNTPGSAMFFLGYTDSHGNDVGNGTPPQGIEAPNVNDGLVFDQPDGS